MLIIDGGYAVIEMRYGSLLAVDFNLRQVQLRPSIGFGLITELVGDWDRARYKMSSEAERRDRIEGFELSLPASVKLGGQRQIGSYVRGRLG
jgi:hypothetical protein